MEFWIWGQLPNTLKLRWEISKQFFVTQSLFTRFKICTWIRRDVFACFPLLQSYFLKSWGYQCAVVYIGRLGRIPQSGRRFKEEPEHLCRHCFTAFCVRTCPKVPQKFPLWGAQALPYCALLWQEPLLLHLPLTEMTLNCSTPMGYHRVIESCSPLLGTWCFVVAFACTMLWLKCGFVDTFILFWEYVFLFF